MSESRPVRAGSARGWAGIVLATLLISVLHHTTPAEYVHWHNVFQHLYYVPTVLAALLFGLRGGLAAGLLAALSHVPDILQTIRSSPDYAFEQAVEMPVRVLSCSLCAVAVDCDGIAEPTRGRALILVHESVA